MKRVYIFKDGIQQASTATRESAVDLIRQYQKQETHPILRSEFSIIVGGGRIYPLSVPEEATQEKIWHGAVGGENVMLVLTSLHETIIIWVEYYYC